MKSPTMLPPSVLWLSEGDEVPFTKARVADLIAAEPDLGGMMVGLSLSRWQAARALCWRL